jgi:cytochrome b involved in lipid metabolism
MRPLILASALLLVLSGCAASEPQAEPSEVVSAQVQSAEPTETTAEPEQSADAEASAEPEVTEAEAETSAESQAERSEEPEAQETEEAEQESEREEEAEASPSPTPTATQTQAPEPEVVGYTLAEVAQKNTSADCWVAIDGGVYDLTMWIRSHPGGSGAITQLCGKDGTSQFLSMHGGQSRPASTLDSYYIGPLR